MAPEVLDPDLEHKDGYGPEVDLWSVGVILYSMLCGFPPFYSENNTTLIRQIRRAEYKFHSPYWDEVSFGAKDLVASLLVANPCRRFTSHQCLEHPWVKNAVDASSQKLHRWSAPAGGPQSCTPLSPPLATLRARAASAAPGCCYLSSIIQVLQSILSITYNIKGLNATIASVDALQSTCRAPGQSYVVLNTDTKTLRSTLPMSAALPPSLRLPLLSSLSLSHTIWLLRVRHCALIFANKV